MTNTRTPEQRSKIMKAVKTKNTIPEVYLRKLIFHLSLRFRLHGKDLPGKPDIVFPGRKKAIFVNGCFWHGHNCSKGKLLKSRLDYWKPKIEANTARDERKQQELQCLGWDALVVWQCELKIEEDLIARLKSYLDN